MDDDELSRYPVDGLEEFYDEDLLLLIGPDHLSAAQRTVTLPSVGQ